MAASFFGACESASALRFGRAAPRPSGISHVARAGHRAPGEFSASVARGGGPVRQNGLSQLRHRPASEYTNGRPSAGGPRIRGGRLGPPASISRVRQFNAAY